MPERPRKFLLGVLTGVVTPGIFIYMETTETTTATATDRQSIRGACPATGRSASACADQTHTACWTGRAAFLKAERALAKMVR